MFSLVLRTITLSGLGVAAIALAACSSTPTVTRERMTLGEANIDGMECPTPEGAFWTAVGPATGPMIEDVSPAGGEGGNLDRAASFRRRRLFSRR